MAKHEFGIMRKDPAQEERFDAYEPRKYHCIQVEDAFIEPILTELQAVDCYWHTLSRAEQGLAYTGITLIPPKSVDGLLKVLSAHHSGAYGPLISLANQAKGQGSYIIHFGI